VLRSSCLAGHSTRGSWGLLLGYLQREEYCSLWTGDQERCLQDGNRDAFAPLRQSLDSEMYSMTKRAVVSLARTLTTRKISISGFIASTNTGGLPFGQTGHPPHDSSGQKFSSGLVSGLGGLNETHDKPCRGHIRLVEEKPMNFHERLLS
jgi:hypothetical protein